MERRWARLFIGVDAEECREFVEPVQKGDALEVIRLLELREAEAQRNLDDFRSTYPKLDAKMRRMRRLDHDYDRLDEWEDLADDPEVDWYTTEFDKRRGIVLDWQRRIDWARDYAGIAPRSSYPDEED